MPSLPRTKTRAATAGFKKPAPAGTPTALSKPVTNWKLDAPERLLAKIASRVPGPGGSDEWVAAPHTPAQLFRETLHEVQTGAQSKARAAALANHLSQFTELPAIQSLVRNPVDERSLGALSDALLTHLGGACALPAASWPTPPRPLR